MIVAGIDVGATGGVAFINTDTGAVEAHVSGDAHTLAELLRFNRPGYTVVEKVGAMPGQGVTSMFSFGQRFGEILGVLAALQLPHALVRPQAWCKVMHMGISGDEPKKKSLEAVRMFFPGVDLKATSRCRTPHSGKVDALLIAEYARRTYMAI